MKYIKKIGYEIEGLWSNNFDELTKKIGGDFTYDGSINIDTIDLEVNGIEGSFSEFTEREYRSNPRCSLERIAKDLDEIKKYFVLANYSCGFHVHISFKSKTFISLLASKHFNDYFVKRIAEMFPEMFALRQGNHYCSPRVRSRKEVIYSFLTGAGDRYKAVNFNAWSKHSTIEFRIFDMNIDMALDYIKATVKIVQDYLDEEMKKQKVVIQKIIKPVIKQQIYV